MTTPAIRNFRPLPTAAERSILVLEEHALVRAGLRALIAATPGLRVAAEAPDVPTGLGLARTHRPDVVLINEPVLDRAGDDGLHAFHRAAPQACVIVLTDGTLAGRRAFAGAHGCLARNAGVRELCSAVTSLLDGGCSTCALRPLCPLPQRAATLSRRERQVAVRVAEGLTSKEIAAELGIKLRTVHTYREALARKLGASSPAVVTRYVIESGLTWGT